MGITVIITFSTPLSEEDDNILTGAAYWLHATANRNGQPEQVPPTGCGKQDPTRPTFYCVGADGHRGRHTYWAPRWSSTATTLCIRRRCGQRPDSGH